MNEVVASPMRADIMEEEGVCVQRLFDACYWGEERWMPRRAEFLITVSESSSTSEMWAELGLEFASGPDELYRYYPFSSYVYVDNRVEAVLEFSGPFQDEIAVLRMPVGKSVRVTVVTELCDTRFLRGLCEDERGVSIFLKSVHVRKRISRPHVRHADVSALEDHYTQHLVPLVPNSARPIFVVGAYRSGTSALTWAIGQHPNIIPLEETGWLPLLGNGALAGQRLANMAKRNFFDVYDISVQEYMAHLGLSIDDFMRKSSLRHTQRTWMEHLAGKTEGFPRDFQIVRNAFNPKRRWIDGSPENTQHIILLRMLFPAAKFIVLLRDPLDVLVSMTRFERAGGDPMNAEDAVAMWMQATQAGFFAWRAFGPDVVDIVPHEMLANAPSTLLQKVFYFLDEPYFSTSANTLRERINSSNLDISERDELRREYARLVPVKEACAFHTEVLQAMEKEWKHDSTAEEKLIERQEEITARMMEVLA